MYSVFTNSYLHSTMHIEDGSSKLAPLYFGPYFVVKRTQAGNYICDPESELMQLRSLHFDDFTH